MRAQLRKREKKRTEFGKMRKRVRGRKRRIHFAMVGLKGSVNRGSRRCEEHGKRRGSKKGREKVSRATTREPWTVRCEFDLTGGH